MNFEEQYPSLDEVFGFFNQDWYHTYKWDGKEPDYQAVIRFCKVVESDELVEKAIEELKDLIEFGKDFDEDYWYDYFMHGSSLGYYPPGGNQTYREWLEDVLKILEEPMEKTKKEFIPEFIGQ